MTKVAYTNARLMDPATGLDAKGSLITQDGKIYSLGPNVAIDGDAKVIDCQGRIVCPGFIDMRAHRVDADSAAAGGFTTVVLQPDQTTPLDNDASIERIRKRCIEANSVKVYPMGAATKGFNGQEITEIGQMLESGAVAFTDCNKPVENAQILSRLLEYAGYFDALIIQFPEEQSLKGDGIAHDGIIATRLGLAGIPVVAEVIQIERDARIAEALDARIHISLISSREGLDAIRAAKARGIKISCSVAPHYLHLNEHALVGYPTFVKVSPPLRSEEDRIALVEGLADGSIDTIVTDHNPKHEDQKRLPFNQAAEGVVGHETALALALATVHSGKVDMMTIIKALTLKPATLLKLPVGSLATGSSADITIFDPDAPWRIDKNALKSKARNTPFDTLPVQGKVWKTIVNGHVIYDQDDA